MVFERAEEFPTHRGRTWTAARSRARPTASPSSPARSTAARRTTSTACRTRSAARSTPTGRASCPTPSRASRTPCPDLIRKSLPRRRAAADLRLRRADAHAHARRRHRRRHRHRDRPRRTGSTRTSTSRRRDELHRRRDRRALLGGGRATTRRDFELEHLPSFEVDVQRRWPSVEKAERLLGWKAQIDVRDGIRADRGVAARTGRSDDASERQARPDHRHHRPGRLLPRRAAAREGLRGPRHGPPRLDREVRPHRAPARPDHAAPGRPARPALARRRAARRQARTRSTTSPRCRSSPSRGSSRR